MRIVYIKIVSKILLLQIPNLLSLHFKCYSFFFFIVTSFLFQNSETFYFLNHLCSLHQKFQMVSILMHKTILSYCFELAKRFITDFRRIFLYPQKTQSLVQKFLPASMLLYSATFFITLSFNFRR